MSISPCGFEQRLGLTLGGLTLGSGVVAPNLWFALFHLSLRDSGDLHDSVVRRRGVPVDVQGVASSFMEP